MAKPNPFATLTLRFLLLLAQATYAAVSPVTLNLTTDNDCYETIWETTDSSNTILASGDSYANNTPYNETIDLPISTGYTFTIHDTAGDGICCVSRGEGSYSLKDAEGTVIASGGEFDSEESTQFDIATVIPVPPSISIISKLGLHNKNLRFLETDFSHHFVSVIKEELSTIKITALPTHGTLKLGSSEVSIEQEISINELNNLNYVPNTDSMSDSFGWNGSDGIYADSNSHVQITLVNLEKIASFAELESAINLANSSSQNDILTLTSDITLTSPLPSLIVISHLSAIITR